LVGEDHGGVPGLWSYMPNLRSRTPWKKKKGTCRRVRCVGGGGKADAGSAKNGGRGKDDKPSPPKRFLFAQRGKTRRKSHQVRLNLCAYAGVSVSGGSTPIRPSGKRPGKKCWKRAPNSFKKRNKEKKKDARKKRSTVLFQNRKKKNHQGKGGGEVIKPTE